MIIVIDMNYQLQYSPMLSLRYLIPCGRDSYGMPHPQGTCVLLEVNTLNELINYFQGRYQNPNVLFELKGVHINEEQCDMAHF